MIMHRYNAEGTNTPSVVGVPCLLGLSFFFGASGHHIVCVWCDA